MGIAYSPQIVRDGLVLHLDAANVKCNVGDIGNLLDLSTNSNYTYPSNNGIITHNSTNKSFSRSNRVSIDFLRSPTSINLPGSFTLSATAIVYESDSTANLGGLLTTHNHLTFLGGGITIRYMSDSDYRISCNTGTGTARTYSTYYGISNIKDAWNFLTMRYIKETNTISLWVNAVNEYEFVYAMAPSNNYVELFNWSTANSSSSAYRIRGEIGCSSVYDRALSDAEIKQNFDAMKGRYGL